MENRCGYSLRKIWSNNFKFIRAYISINYLCITTEIIISFIIYYPNGNAIQQRSREDRGEMYVHCKSRVTCLFFGVVKYPLVVTHSACDNALVQRTVDPERAAVRVSWIHIYGALTCYKPPGRIFRIVYKYCCHLLNAWVWRYSSLAQWPTVFQKKIPDGRESNPGLPLPIQQLEFQVYGCLQASKDSLNDDI